MEKYTVEILVMIGGGWLESLSESETFCKGIAVGISIYQQKIIVAHDRKEPLEIDGESYYIKDSGEQLQELVDMICRWK